jgi:pectate lyase
MAAGGWYPRVGRRPGKWYVAGNFFHGEPEITADNWLAMVPADDDDDLAAAGARAADRARSRSERLRQLARVYSPFEAWPMNLQSAEEAFVDVLARAGATLPRRDAVDARVIESVRTGKTTTEDGIVRDPQEVGGYPKYSFEPSDVPSDEDHDGMPDAWETEHQLDPAAPADGPADADGDGYTNVEEFLNGTNPQEPIDYANLGNNIDAISQPD